ncbi:MAG TPA: SAM-dependent methyltransferase [Candidatus Ozemobacteraceae bacterium]|nr:SAM-dependent methyltransferase [Candidatus Ozemobacteraceae bacterium]
MNTPVFQPQSIWFCAEGWEAGLSEELSRKFPGRTFERLDSGVVGCKGFHPPRPGAEIFPRFFLSEAHLIEASSHREIIRQAGPLVDAALDHTHDRWTLHVSTPGVFTLDGEHYREASARAGLLADLFLERMRTYRKRAMERFTAADAFRQGLVAQFWVLSSQRVIVTVTRERLARKMTLSTLFLPAASQIPADAKAPCRSYYKLEEAFLHAHRSPRPGDTCVDLGAAPGGWSWGALKRGARVTAIDAADLAEHVASHPNCVHRRDNGFEYLPVQPVDWMFCDMIVKPLAALGLLERWLQAQACRSFVLNIKFRGREPGSFLPDIERLQHTYELGRLKIRHLYYDRSEITLIHTHHREGDIR